MSMNNENIILLSGPFSLFDSSGQAWEINAIRIFDEGYGVIDVYVELAQPQEGDDLHEDEVVKRQILARLRQLGYAGPDFGLGDAGLQEDNIIVLESGEAFVAFARSKGWRNLAEDYVDDGAAELSDDTLPAGDAVRRSGDAGADDLAGGQTGRRRNSGNGGKHGDSAEGGGIDTSGEGREEQLDLAPDAVATVAYAALMQKLKAK
jgi:hypothetical protein